MFLLLPQGTIAEEEELLVGNSAGKRPSRSLLTSYSMSASAFGTSRLDNLKSAFKVSFSLLFVP